MLRPFNSPDKCVHCVVEISFDKNAEIYGFEQSEAVYGISKYFTLTQTIIVGYLRGYEFNSSLIFSSESVGVSWPYIIPLQKYDRIDYMCHSIYENV